MEIEKAIVEIERYLNYKRGNYTILECAIESLLTEYNLLDKRYDLLNERVIEKIITGEFNI